MSYETFAERPVSEKNVLAWIEPVQRLLLFTLFSGAVYSKSVDHYVIGVKQGDTTLSEGLSTSLSAGEWYFDATSKTLYVRTTDDADPEEKNISATYRLFYSSIPAILPFDLSSGEAVEYDSRIESTSRFGQEIDEEQTGIALEGQGSIAFLNADGHFDTLYDKLFFENKRVVIYSWSSSLAATDARKIYEGVIDKKSFSSTKARFGLRDNVFQLRNRVNLPLYSSSDGELSDSDLGTPKRRLYGQLKQVQCVGIDKTLEGFTLTGTLAGTAGAQTITGTGTSFLDECSPDDTLTIALENEDIELRIDSVETDTSLTVSENLANTFTGKTGTNSPDRPWRKKNRRWHIAGHKLRAPSTTIATISQLNRFTVSDPLDFFAGDLVKVATESDRIAIRRLSGDLFVLEQNLQDGEPPVGTAVTKEPVSKAYFGPTELIIDRDWSLTNTTEAILELDNLAEFNATLPKTVAGTFSFSNSSRIVTATGSAFQSDFRPRDWIRSGDINHQAWYEVLSVDSETQLTVRVAYAGVNYGGTASKKNVEIVEDDSLITVDTIGMERSGAWVKTASDAVKDLLENDAGLTSLDTDSFTESDEAAPFILSMALPNSIGGTAPVIKSVVNDVNESVFGSLTNDQNFNMRYQILSAEKPESLAELNDDDVISWKVQSNIDIFNKVRARYSPFTDRFNGDDSFEVIEYDNEFVNRYIGTKREAEVTFFLFDEDDARIMAQRYGLFHSLAQSIVTVNAKLNLSTKNLNDKIFLRLDRLYERYGQFDRRKIGIISKITKNGSATQVEFNDLSNIFNRVPAIAPDTANDFSGASENELIKYGYIVDNALEVPDTSSEKELGANIIG